MNCLRLCMATSVGADFEEAGANSPLQSPSVPYGCANPAIPRRGMTRWGVLS